MDLLCEQEVGGSDSSGVGYVKSLGKFGVFKKAETASTFTTDPELWELIDNINPRAMIGHCRATTHGTAQNNMNNHPHYTKGGIITIHNGVLLNHEELFVKHGLERDAQVDSEIIGKLIDTWVAMGTDMVDAIKETTKEIAGSMAVAVLDASKPDDLYLLRRTGYTTLSLAYNNITKTLFFATQETALKSCLAEFETELGIFTRQVNASDFMFYTVPDNTIIKITPEGITTDKLPDAPVYTKPSTYQSYQSTGDGAELYCKTCKCSWLKGDGYGHLYCKHSKPEVARLNAEIEASEKKKPTTSYSQETLRKNKLRRLMEKWGGPPSANFMDTMRIKKPSKRPTVELEDRLDVLVEIAGTRELSMSEESEMKRINDAIDHRESIIKISLESQKLANSRSMTPVLTGEQTRLIADSASRAMDTIEGRELPPYTEDYYGRGIYD